MVLLVLRLQQRGLGEAASRGGGLGVRRGGLGEVVLVAEIQRTIRVARGIHVCGGLVAVAELVGCGRVLGRAVLGSGGVGKVGLLLGVRGTV